MAPFTLFVTLLALSSAAYYVGRRKAFALAGRSAGFVKLHSQPGYHGALAALWCAIPALLIFGFWLAFEPQIITHVVVSALPESQRGLAPDRLGLLVNDIRNLVSGNIVSQAVDPAMRAAADPLPQPEDHQPCRPGGDDDRARDRGGFHRTPPHHAGPPRPQSGGGHPDPRFDRVLNPGDIHHHRHHPFGALRGDPLLSGRPGHGFPLRVGLEPPDGHPQGPGGLLGAFGAVPVFLGTALISVIAMAVAVPIGLMSAIYLSEYAGKRFRAVAKPLIEVLAGIPTVVYGFFAALTVAPFIREAGEFLGLEVASESALAAGLVMGIMIIPFVSSLSDDFINAVPQSLRDGAYSLGATKSETIRQVIVPAAIPGIIGGVLLAVSRAIGETMIVVMAAGLSANLTVNPLQAVTTVTVQIVTLLVGDQEFDSPKTLAAFALGLILFVATLCLNVIALYVVRKYREQYE